MSLPILIRYDRGHRGQAPAPKTLREHRVQLPVRLSIHSRRGYDDPTVISPVVIIGKENTGRRSPSCERNDIFATDLTAKTSRFPSPPGLTEAYPESRPKIPIRKRHVRIREQNRSRKPQSQRLGLLVTGIIFHELRALVKFRIGNVTGVHPSDEVARGKKGMTLHP